MNDSSMPQEPFLVYLYIHRTRKWLQWFSTASSAQRGQVCSSLQGRTQPRFTLSHRAGISQFTFCPLVPFKNRGESSWELPCPRTLVSTPTVQFLQVQRFAEEVPTFNLTRAHPFDARVSERMKVGCDGILAAAMIIQVVTNASRLVCPPVVLNLQEERTFDIRLVEECARVSY